LAGVAGLAGRRAPAAWVALTSEVFRRRLWRCGGAATGMIAKVFIFPNAFCAHSMNCPRDKNSFRDHTWYLAGFVMEVVPEAGWSAARPA
jgi:hypothetical protein